MCHHRSLHWRLPALAALLAALTLSLLAGGALAQDLDPETVKLLLESPAGQQFVPGEILVKMKTARGEPADVAAAVAASVPGLDSEMQPTSGGELLMRLAPSPAAARGEEDLEARTLAAVAELSQNPDVEYAQPNYILRIAAAPDDARYDEQWHYFDNGSGSGEAAGGIDLPTAWERTTGSRDVVVAVLDTGILPDHPDIAGSPNLIPGYDMVSNGFRANDGTSRDDDPTDPGDAVKAGECGPGSPRLPNSWHGTHVAATVGVGKTDNGRGVAGVNWEVSVMPVRVLGRCGGTTRDIADGIRWAVGMSVPYVDDNPTPAKVINLSLGHRGACRSSLAMRNAIRDARARGATVVAAAGNDAEDAAGFIPAGCKGVITVAASNRRGRLVKRYSNYGETVEILAPGGDVNEGGGGVLSMVKGGYAFMNGTSMAAPHVAGVAALLLAEEPDLSPDEVLRRLQANVLPRSDGECPRPCGAGLLSADLWSDRLRIAPSSFSVGKGEPREITASLVRGGVPQEGVTVRFSSSDPAAVEVTASATTDDAGRAVATVERLAGGEATIEARVDGLAARAPVKVPAVSLLGLLLIAAGALYLTRNYPG